MTDNIRRHEVQKDIDECTSTKVQKDIKSQEDNNVRSIIYDILSRTEVQPIMKVSNLNLLIDDVEQQYKLSTAPWQYSSEVLSILGICSQLKSIIEEKKDSLVKREEDKLYEWWDKIVNIIFKKTIEAFHHVFYFRDKPSQWISSLYKEAILDSMYTELERINDLVLGDLDPLNSSWATSASYVYYCLYETLPAFVIIMNKYTCFKIVDEQNANIECVITKSILCVYKIGKFTLT